MKELSKEQKILFFQFLVMYSDDLSKLAFVWLSCSNQCYIRPKLEAAFAEDFESWFSKWQQTI